MKVTLFILAAGFLITAVLGGADGKDSDSKLALGKKSGKNYCSSKCFPSYKLEWLQATCSYGVIECRLPHWSHYTHRGYSCDCAPKSPSPSPSSSPKPKCVGHLYDECLPAYKYWYLKKVCPYGVEYCYTHYGPGYKCTCIYKPSPTPTPTRTPSPTPSNSPKPRCYGIYYDRCYPWIDSTKCPYGITECTYYQGHYKHTGYKCKCEAPPPPSGLSCPASISLFTKSRSTEYEIDLKQTSGCFKVEYFFDYSPYTIFVYYEGKTLIKDRVNYPPKAPAELCYYGHSSIITIKINSGLYKKIDFKVYCPTYKSHH